MRGGSGERGCGVIGENTFLWVAVTREYELEMHRSVNLEAEQ